ncbi:MAG: dihydrodipicolinate synthase family protein [Marinovum sp.]|nr:dihydrodipicolinate synthase family protein [Marinovum sp.]
MACLTCLGDVMNFTGVLAFPLTPMNADGTLDEGCFRAGLDRLLSSGVNSIAIMGSTGLAAYLPMETRLAAIRCASGHLGNDIEWLVGVSALTTRDALSLSRAAQEAGADAIFAAPMSYTPLTEREVVGYYAALSQVGLDLCIYNNPSTTKFAFSHPLIAELSHLPNVRAIKMPLPSEGMGFGVELAGLRATCLDGFAVGYSGDWGCAEGLRAGADAWFTAVGGVLPEAILALSHAAVSGDANAFAHVQDQCAKLMDLCKTHGSLRVLAAITDRGAHPVTLPAPLDIPRPRGFEQALDAAMADIAPLL